MSRRSPKPDPLDIWFAGCRVGSLVGDVPRTPDGYVVLRKYDRLYDEEGEICAGEKVDERTFKTERLTLVRDRLNLSIADYEWIFDFETFEPADTDWESAMAPLLGVTA